MRKQLLLPFVMVAVLSYMYFGTGIHSDDYIFLLNFPGWPLSKVLTLDFADRPQFFYFIPMFYYDFFQFYMFQSNIILYDFVKIITSSGCMILVYLFAKDYMRSQKAVAFAAMFMLFPTHDSTNYLVVGQYMIIIAALVMYAHCLIHNNKHVKGFLVGLLASFASYASLPYIFGLSLSFLMKKQYKKFVLFVLPQIINLVYFVSITKIFVLGEYRTADMFNVPKIAKQYVLQMATFLDAVVGLSFWAKIYYSVAQLSLPSIIVGCLVVYLFYRYYEPGQGKVSRELLYSSVATLFVAFGMFAVTGMYPQLAFNLGNRVTIYGSLLISLVIVLFVMNGKKTSTLIFAVFVFSVLGISDHWKSWNNQQQVIIKNIGANRDLAEFDKSKELFVSHNQYSQLGGIAHIEFFSDGGMARTIFKFSTDDDYKVEPINKRYFYKNREIIDKKFGTKIKVDDYVYVYDSNNDVLLKVSRDEIPSYIEMLPDDTRHWIQLLDKENWIRKLVLKLMPRLEYAL